MRWDGRQPYERMTNRLSDAREWLREVGRAADGVRRLGREREALRERCGPNTSSFDARVSHIPGDGMSAAQRLIDFERDHSAEIADCAALLGRFNEMYSDALSWPRPIPTGAEVARRHYVLGETYNEIARRDGCSPSTPRMQERAFLGYVADAYANDSVA